MRLLNQTQHTLLADRVILAQTPLSRMRGLLGRKEFLSGEALVITHCNSIHMFFMKFSIDVIFVDREGRVVGLLEKIRPFCLSPVFWRADRAIELPLGTIAFSRTGLGDTILMEPGG